MWKGSGAVVVKSIGSMIKTLGVLIKGTAPRRLHLYMVMVLAIFYATMLSIAIALFPAPGYSFLNNTVSEMGSFASNPAGWWVFSLNDIFLGVCVIPHFIYIYRRLVPTSKFVAFFALIAGFVSGAGFALVGSFPMDFADPHNYSAGIAFGGFFATIMIVMLLFIWKIAHNEAWPTKKQFWVLYGPLIVACPLVFLMPNIPQSAFYWAVDPRWFSWPLWEWTFMLSITYWMIIMAWIVPDQPT